MRESKIGLLEPELSFKRLTNDFLGGTFLVHRLVGGPGQVCWKVALFGQVLSPHHSDQLSQRSQVCWIAP